MQVEDQPFNSNVKIEEDFVTLEDTSSNEDEDETYHPNKKIEINGSSHSGSKRSRRCRKTVEEPTVDKPTTMFDLIYERVPKSIKAKRNIGDSKKRKLVLYIYFISGYYHPLKLTKFYFQFCIL